MELNSIKINQITNEYYSKFCGIDLVDSEIGIQFICSEARDKEVVGFGCKYTIYALRKENTCVVSYSPKYRNFFQNLQGSSAEKILDALNDAFKLKKMQLMIFRQECVQDYGNARILKKDDYILYEKFFCLQHPTADPSGWLQEYFEEKVAKEYFVGYVLNDSLVSVCDAPDMPHMRDVIQHTGISTLKDERRKGFAKCTAALAAHHLIAKGVCPQWECHAENVASIALAESIGFVKYGLAYILEE